MEPKRQRFSIGYFIAALTVLFLLQSVFFAPRAENLSYSEFKALLTSNSSDPPMNGSSRP
jgi:hypothetical protein